MIRNFEAISSCESVHMDSTGDGGVLTEREWRFDRTVGVIDTIS